MLNEDLQLEGYDIRQKLEFTKNQTKPKQTKSKHWIRNGINESKITSLYFFSF